MRSLIKQWNQQNQRLTPVFNGIGGGGAGGGSSGNGGGNNGSSSDYDPDLKIKLEPGLGGIISRHHQGNFVSDQSLSDPGFENFSSPMEEQLSLGQFPDLASTSGKGANLLGLLDSTKMTKRRKRRSGESWRSPKRKHEDGGTIDSSSSDSTPLGTPTSREPSDNRVPTPTSTTSGLEFSLCDLENSVTGEKSQSDIDNEEVIPVDDAEDDDIFKSAIKKVKKSKEEKKTASDILFDLENKNLVPPSVSITPITSNQMNTPNFNSVLSGMGLERRPGIEIIPISSTPTTTLPSSITITPITTKPVMEERSKDRKSSRSKSEEKGRQEKKRKRKREDSPMGPPEKVPPKSDPLSKPVTVSIKPAESSPRPTSPAGTVSRKYSSSPTHTSPLAIVGKSSPGSSSKSKPPPQQSPKHSPGYGTSSPKNNLTSSPKHGTSSPKHQSSSGKPSMSALKSAVSSPSKSDSKTKSKDGRDKDRKSYSSSSSGHSSPQLKSASVKLKQLDLSTIDVPQSLQSGGSTPPNSGDGGKTSAGQSRNRKSSISAVVDKLKSALHCGEEGNGKEKKEGKDRSTSGKVESKSTNKPGETKSGEYMVKPSSDGIKITINKTRTKESSKVKSSSSSSSSSATASSNSSSSTSGNASPKMHTGLKSGVNSGPASKKSLLPGQKSGSPVLKTSSSNSSSSSSSSSGKPLVKSALSLQKSIKPSGSPKTSDPNRIREKPRISKGPEKSVFSSSKSDARKLSPSALREDSEYKLPISSSQLVVEGLVKSLDTKFQIPKLSARNANSNQSVDDKKVKDTESRSSDSPKVLDLASKEIKYGSGSKNSEDSRVSTGDSKTKPLPTSTTITIGSLSPKLTSTKIGSDVTDSPNISILPVQSEREDKDIKGNNVSASSSHSGVEDVLSSLKMELPISSLSFTSCEPALTLPSSPPLPPDLPSDETKKVVCTTSQQEAAELLLDFSATSKIETRLLSMTDRAMSAIPLRRNTPPPPPPPPAFPGSPSVTMHIVKSPAPSSDLPLVIQSPHSSSPCITDDELMDEALVGIGK